MPLALTCGIGRTLSLLASAASAQVILIDGDTVDIDGIRIRLLDIDTRETGKPRCENELVLGLKEGTPAPTAGQRPGHLPSQRQGPLQPNPRPCLCQQHRRRPTAARGGLGAAMDPRGWGEGAAMPITGRSILPRLPKTKLPIAGPAWTRHRRPSETVGPTSRGWWSPPFFTPITMLFVTAFLDGLLGGGRRRRRWCTSRQIRNELRIWRRTDHANRQQRPAPDRHTL
jgi:hypothetical protein